MQPLAPKGKGYHPAAEETLAMASEARGQAGMLRTSAPIGNERMLSEGAADKVEVNTQPYNNQTHTVQNQKQNILSSVPQAQANAIGGVRKGNADMSQAEYKAQEMANSRMAEVLYANDGGAALMKINELAADPAQMKMFMQRIGESKMMAQGNNPQSGFQSTNFAG